MLEQMKDNQTNQDGQDEPDGMRPVPTINVDELKRGDGVITRPAAQNSSLLRYVLDSVTDNKDYRRELKQLRFATTDEADNFITAMQECRELGMDETPILDTALARSAGTGQSLVAMVVDALTHTTFTTNNKPGQYQQKNKSSPLS